jgi:peptidoglycan recognition protein
MLMSITACPTIISRSGWGARAPTSSSALSTPVPYVVIHHGASAACSSQSSCISMVQSYQNQHMDVNGWSDIGYNFIVGGDGNVYEGRGWTKQGAHAPGYNAQSIGICFVGTFTSKYLVLNEYACVL